MRSAIRPALAHGLHVLGAVRGRAGAALPSVLQILSTYGADAYMWIPGVGTVSGFDAKNWLNSNYTTAVAVDQQVGSVSSGSPAGTIGLAQATAGSRPFLRQTGGVYSWEFDGTDDRLTMSAAPLSFPSDHTLMVAATPTASASTKTLFSVRGTGRLELTHTTGNLFSCQWSGINTVSITPTTAYLDVPAVVTCSYSGGIASMRVNGGYVADQPHTPGSFTFTQNHIGATNGGSFGSHYKGKLHGVIFIGAAITHTEKTVMEQFLAALAGTTVTPDKARTYFDTSSLLNAYMGDYTLSSGVYRMKLGNGMFYMNITAENAEMYCKAGDLTPYRVVIDELNLNNSTAPSGLTTYGAPATLTTDIVKIPLFSGAAGTRKVGVVSDNSSGGQQFGLETTGKLLALTGDNVSVSPVGTQYYLADPACPAIATAPRAANGGTLPNYAAMNNSSTWASRNVESIHFRAAFDELYVFSASNAVEVSVDGGAFTRYILEAPYSILGNTVRSWKKITGLTATTLRSFIICGATTTSVNGYLGVISGLMLTGASQSLQAPSGTRRHVAVFGASQVEGVDSTAQGFVDAHFVQNALDIYTLAAGYAGQGIVAGTTAMPTWAAEVTNKDIIVLSIGINSADDANFQTDYQSLINAALTAGFSKVICRGLVQASISNAGKNAKIAAAVAAVADARVVYADVSTWTATTDGSAGIHMPDGSHPNRNGYLTMASYWVRDHASLYA